MAGDCAAMLNCLRLHRSVGLALIEVLIAFALISLGSLGLLRLQRLLHDSADFARQRAEAVRLAEADLEGLRQFSRLEAGGGEFAWADITPLTATTLEDLASNTGFSLQRSVALGPTPRLKAVDSRIGWTDRDGAAQQLTLSSLIAAIDPAAIGALALRRDPGLPVGARARHPLIPLDAKELPDGRLVHKPDPRSTRVWIYDARSGRVIARCSAAAGLTSAELTAASLGDCRSLSGLLLTGQVRFATDTTSPTRLDAEQPRGTALGLNLQLTLSSSGHPDPAWECEDDAPDDAPVGSSTALAVRYVCVVQPAGSPPQWSGRLDLRPIGWTLAASGDSAYQVCRYSADHNGNGRIDNREHPQRYNTVVEPLGDQNFLVIRAGASCPTDVAANLADLANWVNDSTAAHQP